MPSADDWIAVTERLPEQREKPYQVIALCVKRYKEMCYAGEPVRGIYQDWVLRNWPQNYTHWMPFPALPADGVQGMQPPKRYDLKHSSLGGDMREAEDGEYVRWDSVEHLFAYGVGIPLEGKTK